MVKVQVTHWNRKTWPCRRRTIPLLTKFVACNYSCYGPQYKFGKTWEERLENLHLQLLGSRGIGYAWVCPLSSTNNGKTATHMMSHIWMSRVTRMHESCHTYEWVMSHMLMSHVTRINESCHTYGWVMLHIWMIHVTRMDESCQTYGWVMSHVWTSHVTCANVPRHTCIAPVQSAK